MVDIKVEDARRIAKPIKWINHPDYTPGNYDNDFAIIKLRENVEFVAGKVGPACLPDPATSYDDVDATVTGWGRLRSNSDYQPNILQKVSKRITLFLNLNQICTYKKSAVPTMHVKVKNIACKKRTVQCAHMVPNL